MFFLSLQVLGCLFYAYYVFVRLCIPQFHNISMQLFDLRVMVLCVFNSILPGTLFKSCTSVLLSTETYECHGNVEIKYRKQKIIIFTCDICAGVLVLLLAFFAFLHCWLNAFAEMLRFGDRMFYKV